MLVVVTGGRDYNDLEHVTRELDLIAADPDIDHLVVIQGHAKGADRMARLWCEMRRIECISIKANWDELGRKAGIFRNQEMLNFGPPDLGLSFPGGVGTAHMTRILRKALIPVKICIP